MESYEKSNSPCVNCRKRRLKCDRTKPACLRCQQAEYECQGYQETVPIRVRAQRADRSRRGATRKPVRRYPDSATGSSSTGSSRGTSSLSPSLAVSPADQSVCVYLHNYVPDDTTRTVHIIASQIVHHASSNEAVRLAMSAIGLAIMANMRNNPRLLIDARADYARALEVTNTALRSKTHCLEETTLNAVMLLGMFEVISCEAPKSLENWQKHIGGAAAFLELWNMRQIRSPIGMQLFTQLRTELMANCLRTQTRVPKTVRKLSKIVQSCRPVNDARVEDLVDLIAELSDLLADVKDNGLPDPVEAIGRARDIDNRLHLWSLSLPLQWQCALRNAPRQKGNVISELSYNDYYYVYGDLWACNIWSYYRNARIMLNLLIRDRLLPFLAIQPYPEWKPLMQEARTNIERLSADILLSVPFAIATQYASFQRGVNWRRAGGCLGGYYISWPLYVAASVQSPRSPLREWALGQLQVLGNSMGIGQALLMRKVLTGELQAQTLSVYDYCHSYYEDRKN
ncbi:hypothetical protein BJX63DRAFT_139042 [Aspergillus granulosus]|uniref:Zn(2)-C6 fungal-type domain-containing protein n=1 Tax=Aspergillus granulosus TaxID=176169 RepID=A0ABR4HME7_9EURO